MIHVYVSYPSVTEAKKISHMLLNKHLVACANFFPVHSSYRWKGRTVHKKEIISFVSTTKKHYKQIEKIITKHHSYTVPCIMELPVNRVYTPYKKWVMHETS
ncbi:divalent-cation tolerance protein CutA [Patescibacteria group bacterium]